jgi:hypothetical protein
MCISKKQNISINFLFYIQFIYLVLIYFLYILYKDIIKCQRHSRACGSCHDFLDKGLLLTRQLLKQVFLWLIWIHHFESFKVATIHWLTITQYHKWPWICSVCRNHNQSISHAWHIAVTRVIRRVTLVEQELFSLPEDLRPS